MKRSMLGAALALACLAPLSAAGELHVAPARSQSAKTPPAPRPALSEAEANAKTAAAVEAFDKPLVAPRPHDDTPRVPVIIRSRGMSPSRIVYREEGWEANDAKEQADRLLAQKKAKQAAAKKKLQTKQRQARAARTAAQVRAGL